MAVAVAGSSDTSSAYVARSRRAIASWSQRYGITDDATPTPIPAASATGSSSAGSAAQPPIGVTTTSATSIDAARPSIPIARSPCATLLTEDDVRGEEHGVRERESDAERLSFEAHVREEVHTEDGQCQGSGVARCARAERREGENREKLDRGDRAERQAVDRQVEARVHHREHRSPRQERPQA